MKLTSIDFSCQVAKTVEAHGCKPWVTNLSIVLHALGMLTTNIIFCIIFLEYIILTTPILPLAVVKCVLVPAGNCVKWNVFD